MLLVIGVVILLGMAGTVLYNQMVNFYNDAVRSRSARATLEGQWQELLRQAESQGQLSHEQAEHLSILSLQEQESLPELPDTVQGKVAWGLMWKNLHLQRVAAIEAVERYEESRRQFPFSLLTRVCGFQPLT